MDLALPADSLPLQAAALWTWLLECADAVAKAMSSKRTLTKQERRIYALAEELGSSVLDAEDLADLHVRLHAVARSERLLQFELAALSEMAPLPKLDAREVEATFTNALGDSHLVRECARLLAARITLIGEFLATQPELDLDAVAVHVGQLSDFRCPPLIRSLFHDTLAGEAALLALLAPVIDPARWTCAPWVRLALLEQIRSSSLAHLRLISLVPSAVIPEDLLSREDHLNPAELDAESAMLARYVISPNIMVDRKYAHVILDEVLGDSPPSPGVLALFAD
jgi:hypothetical protein